METHFGYIHSTLDALLVIQACKEGALKRVSRRLIEVERSDIRPGSIFVFRTDESNVLVLYSEHKLKYQRSNDGQTVVFGRRLEFSVKSKQAASFRSSEIDSPKISGAAMLDDAGAKGTLYFKDKGLIKKTLSIKVDGHICHLIAYSVLNMSACGVKQPSMDPFFADIAIPSVLLNNPLFKFPVTPISADGNNNHFLTLPYIGSIDQQANLPPKKRRVSYDSAPSSSNSDWHDLNNPKSPNPEDFTRITISSLINTTETPLKETAKPDGPLDEEESDENDVLAMSASNLMFKALLHTIALL